MFNFLGTPNQVGSSCMQGWRINMEDSHTHILSLPDDPGTAFFGVYDGHGGASVAQYAGKHLHKMVVKREEYDTNVPQAMKQVRHLNNIYIYIFANTNVAYVFLPGLSRYRRANVERHIHANGNGRIDGRHLCHQEQQIGMRERWRLAHDRLRQR